jgi:hypothetical protein
MAIDIYESQLFNIPFEHRTKNDLDELLAQNNLEQTGPRGGIIPTTRSQKIEILRAEKVDEGPNQISMSEHRRLVWEYTIRNRAGQQEGRNPGNAIEQWIGNMAESLVRLGCGETPVYMKESGTSPDLLVNHCIFDVKAMKSKNYNPDGFAGTGGYEREPKNNLAPPNNDDKVDAFVFVRVTQYPKKTGPKGTVKFPSSGAEANKTNYVDGNAKISFKNGANEEFRCTVIGWLSYKDTFHYSPRIPGGIGYGKIKSGGITERGMHWMAYQVSDNLEIYDFGLNKINVWSDIAELNQDFIDNSPPPNLPFLTTVDAHRVALGLLARGIISDNEYEDLVSNLHFQIPRDRVPTILQRSQYNVLLNWGRENDFISEASFSRFEEIENIWNEAENEEE